MRNILKEEGISPGPYRMSDSWTNFVERHKDTLWACDIFSVKTVTTRGLRDTFVLVWICMSTREVIALTSTDHLKSTRVVDQTKYFLDETAGRDAKPAIVIHDRDTKFSKEFKRTLQSRGVKANPLPKASPYLIGRCERFIETIKIECLSKFIMFDKHHLDPLVAEFVYYYNHQRSHMERDHLPPIRELPKEVDRLRLDEIEVKFYVGGSVKAFERKAA